MHCMHMVVPAKKDMLTVDIFTLSMHCVQSHVTVLQDGSDIFISCNIMGRGQ